MWGDKEEDYAEVRVFKDGSGKCFTVDTPSLPYSHTMHNGWEIKLKWLAPAPFGSTDHYVCIASELKNMQVNIELSEEAIQEAHAIAEEITRRFRARFGTKAQSSKSNS